MRAALRLVKLHPLFQAQLVVLIVVVAYLLVRNNPVVIGLYLLVIGTKVTLRGVTVVLLLGVGEVRGVRIVAVRKQVPGVARDEGMMLKCIMGRASEEKLLPQIATPRTRRSPHGLRTACT